MRTFLSAVLIPAICFTLAADTTGRFTGKVTGRDGKPIPNAVITISRLDITWTKELKVNEKGVFLQVGLEPKDFHLSLEAPGYQPLKDDIKITIGDILRRDFVLLTAKEAQAEAQKTAAASAGPGEAQSISGSAFFNQGLESYNQQKFAEALPNLEKGITDLKEALKLLPDGDQKTALAARMPVAERVYGTTLYEVGKGDPDKKDLLIKAEPYLAGAYARNPKDQRTLTALIEVSKAKDDAVAEKKYQDALDTLIGPRPELAYNDGVTAFNNGKFKEAKAYVTKAIAVDPKFADSYWLLGVVDFSLNDIPGARTSFKTYLELAPTGKKASEVKEFLKELPAK